MIQRERPIARRGKAGRSITEEVHVLTSYCPPTYKERRQYRRKRQNKQAAQVYIDRIKSEHAADDHITHRELQAFDTILAMKPKERSGKYPGALLGKRIRVSRQRAAQLIGRLESLDLIRLDRGDRDRGFKIQLVRHRKGSAILGIPLDQLSREGFSGLAKELGVGTQKRSLDSSVDSGGSTPSSTKKGEKPTKNQSMAIRTTRAKNRAISATV